MYGATSKSLSEGMFGNFKVVPISSRSRNHKKVHLNFCALLK